MHQFRNRSALFVSIAVVGLVAVLGFVLAPGGGANTPITWTPVSLNETVPAGTSHTVTASFVASQNFSNVQALVEPPALQPYVQATPPSFANIVAGQTYSLTLALSAPATATPTTINGKIKLVGNGQTALAWRLPIELSITQSGIATKGVIFEVPLGWEAQEASLDSEGPVLMTNFGAQYGHGGVIPDGGAEIDIVRLPRTTMPLNDIIARELAGAISISTSPRIIDGESGIEVNYSMPYTASLTESTRLVYVPRGEFLFKFILTFVEGEPQANDFTDAFETLLGQIQFMD